MALVGSFECAETQFDIYDGERVPVGKSKYKYYVTPNRLIKIELWLLDNNIDKIISQDQMQYLINNNLIGSYNE